ncbi:MAG: hypothetical protein PHW22_05155, partial [Bacilli bacterium]|nr:hypothetical protein [Bacilli bacterium]
MEKEESSNLAENSTLEENERGKTFGEYWHMLRKHWIGIIVCTVVAFAVGLSYDLGLKGDKFEASGSCMVLSVEKDETETSVTQYDINYSLVLLQTMKDFMKNDLVLQSVSDSLMASGYKNSSGDPYTIKQIDKMLDVTPRTFSSTAKSLFLDVTAVSPDANLSINIVNYCLDNTVNITATDDSYALLKNSLIITSRARKES